ncbi:MAG: hypothetical protein ABW321_13515 [Polyangiales bacterium]
MVDTRCPQLRAASRTHAGSRAFWCCGLSWLLLGCRLGAGAPALTVEDDLADFVRERGDAAVSGDGDKPRETGDMGEPGETPAPSAPSRPQANETVDAAAAIGVSGPADEPTQSPAGAASRPGTGNAGAASGGITDAGVPPGRAPTQPGAASCGQTADIPVCNPITNRGCAGELGMQCDVDLLAGELAGQCVFSAPPPDGGTCLNIPPTESCPAGSTCVDFSECRKLCLCDDDCGAGECCAEDLGAQGFKVCSPC